VIACGVGTLVTERHIWPHAKAFAFLAPPPSMCASSSRRTCDPARWLPAAADGIFRAMPNGIQNKPSYVAQTKAGHWMAVINIAGAPAASHACVADAGCVYVLTVGLATGACSRAVRRCAVWLINFAAL
jgi:hypothetical protein